jgi:calcineurin-like phosphoesterase family protein
MVFAGAALVPVPASATSPHASGGPADSTPPTTPNKLKATALGPGQVNLSWKKASDNVGVTRYEIFRGGVRIGTSTWTSYTDLGVAKQKSYAYTVDAIDSSGNVSARSSRTTVTTPKTWTFSFGAAGDMGANSRTAYSLNKLDASGVDFFLAIGDLDYDQVSSPSAWCSYIKSHLPTLGSSFPIEVLAGNHEDDTIQEHAACLPDRFHSKIGPNSIYGGEYYFDYPESNPLVRVIMISPKLQIKGASYRYTIGSPHYNFVASALDDAKAKGIPWTVVGHHMTSPGGDLTNLLVAKKVDLVIYGHNHGYSRGKQLTTCASGTKFDCVSDDGSDGLYPKHGGTVFLRNGSFGQGSPNGFSKFTVTADRIDAEFVGKATDVWSIR